MKKRHQNKFNNLLKVISLLAVIFFSIIALVIFAYSVSQSAGDSSIYVIFLLFIFIFILIDS